MPCAECQEPCSCPVVERLQAFTADATGAGKTVHPRHNWLRMHVAFPATVTAGSVFLDLALVDPGGSPGTLVWAQIGEVTWSAQNSTVIAHTGPVKARQVRARMAGYAGSGEVVVLLESWREAT